MRGYFGIGVEGVSKPRNLGSLFRCAHAFGASFVFSIAADYSRRLANQADTSDTQGQVPLYRWDSLEAMQLPQGCTLVGIELLDDAAALPSFRLPRNAAYVLGPERGSLSPALQARCEHVVQIPTRFAINLAVAGSLVMYDRLLSLGRFGERPIMPGGPPPPQPSRGGHGAPVFRTRPAPPR